MIQHFGKNIDINVDITIILPITAIAILERVLKLGGYPAIKRTDPLGSYIGSEC